jgi:hypothetical protein
MATPPRGPHQASCRSVSPHVTLGAAVRARIGRMAIALAVVAPVAALSTVGHAQASTLRRIAVNIDTFASDGVRYVAWEASAPGVTSRVPIVVLDTRTGHSFKVDAPCGLHDGAPASAGRFLLQCGDDEERALLDARTGKVTMLPKPPSHEYGEYGPIWEGVGSRYVIGKAGEHARCHRTKRHESCTALYDIGSGAVSEVPESLVPDPDRPGALPVCRTLRRKVFLRSEFETLEGGLGPLSPLTSGFSYSDGVLSLAEIGESPGTNILIDRCDGSQTILRVGREGRVRKPFSWNLELRAGVLTWDTGHQANGFEEEEDGEAAPGELRHGTLTAYRLKMHRRRTWRLPLLPLKIVGEPPNGKRSEIIHGVFGYSAHTAYNVFWITPQRVSRSCYKTCDVTNEASAIFAARL